MSSFNFKIPHVNSDENEIDYSISRKFQPNLPLELSEKDQEEIIRQYIYDSIGLRIDDITELEKHRSANGKPLILLVNEHDRSELKFCIAYKKIPGSVIIRGLHQLKSLGEITEINGDLGFSNSEIENLGSLKKISGSFWIAQGGVNISRNYIH